MERENRNIEEIDDDESQRNLPYNMTGIYIALKLKKHDVPEGTGWLPRCGGAKARPDR